MDKYLPRFETVSVRDQEGRQGRGKFMTSQNERSRPLDNVLIGFLHERLQVLKESRRSVGWGWV